MSRIFVSHSSDNNAQAIALSRWLEREGWNDIVLDLDPERGIKAGERWEDAPQQEARGEGGRNSYLRFAAQQPAIPGAQDRLERCSRSRSTSSDRLRPRRAGHSARDPLPPWPVGTLIGDQQPLRLIAPSVSIRLHVGEERL